MKMKKKFCVRMDDVLEGLDKERWRAEGETKDQERVSRKKERWRIT